MAKIEIRPLQGIRINNLASVPGYTSIIIPCYNKRAYVAAAIESALAQTSSCEVIVVDDGSTDGSLEEIRRFAGCIRWETGPNRGGAAARNRGLGLARGEWIQFLDADDILPQDKIAVQIAALKGGGQDEMAFCPWSRFHDDGRIDLPDPRPYWRDHVDGFALLVDMWYRGGFFPLHAWLVRRSLIDRVGGWNEALTGDDDGEFFGRLLVYSGRVHFIDETSVLYRDTPLGAVSRDRSLPSVQSYMKAYLSVSRAILERRDSRAARLACLGRLRSTAYQLRQFDEIVAAAANEERHLGLWDFSPQLPLGARVLIGVLGIERGLSFYRMIEPLIKRIRGRE